MRRLASFAIVLAFLAFSGGAPRAQEDVPLDFISGDGWFTKQSSSTPPIGKASFGADGGVKNGNWTGNLVFVDKGLDLKVRHLIITGYLRVGTDGTDAKGRTTGTRDICGTASSNLFGNVHFRARLTDNDGHDRRDTFRIGLAAADGAVVYTAQGSLGDPTPGGGKIRIVKGNKSSTPPASPPDCRVSFEAVPPPPPPPTTTRFEETAATLEPAGAWSELTGTSAGATLSDDRAVFTAAAGARATFPFSGTSVTWIGLPCEVCGIARVFVDGTLAATVDTFAPSRPAASTGMFTASGLTAGSHTLLIEVTGTKNASSGAANVVVDAFDVGGGSGSGGGGTDVTRFEETSPSVTYAGTWLESIRPDHSGGAARKSVEAGSRATFAFTGTGVRWIGFKSTVTGIARVFLDGTFVAEVDTAASSEQPQAVVFERTGLPAGAHTLAIEVTGRFNPPATSAWIAVDAFDVMTGGGEPPPEPTPTHFEESAAALAPAAAWSGVTSASTGVTLSGGGAVIASAAGATATFAFTGTGVSWIGFPCERCGIARVSLDGAVVATVDTYAPSRPAASGSMFTRTGLASGSHTLVIEVTGTRNASSLDAFIVVDAFDVS
jgi:hypothetical protein